MANETKLANIINPQVMQDMVSAGLPKALKFTQFAQVNEDLKGVPGDTITIPLKMLQKVQKCLLLL